MGTGIFQLHQASPSSWCQNFTLQPMQFKLQQMSILFSYQIHALKSWGSSALFRFQLCHVCVVFFTSRLKEGDLMTVNQFWKCHFQQQLLVCKISKISVTQSSRTSQKLMNDFAENGITARKTAALLLARLKWDKNWAAKKNSQRQCQCCTYITSVQRDVSVPHIVGDIDTGRVISWVMCTCKHCVVTLKCKPQIASATSSNQRQ